MDELASTEFRKRFARLLFPTTVTVNGHPIGMWVPVSPQATTLTWKEEPPELPQTLSSAQAQRDELLRKINRR